MKIMKQFNEYSALLEYDEHDEWMDEPKRDTRVEAANMGKSARKVLQALMEYMKRNENITFAEVCKKMNNGDIAKFASKVFFNGKKCDVQIDVLYTGSEFDEDDRFSDDDKIDVNTFEDSYRDNNGNKLVCVNKSLYGVKNWNVWVNHEESHEVTRNEWKWSEFNEQLEGPRNMEYVYVRLAFITDNDIVVDFFGRPAFSNGVDVFCNIPGIDNNDKWNIFSDENLNTLTELLKK